MAVSPEDVLRELAPPPKNLVGKDGQKVSVLISTWIENCAGKCAVAELTQVETNAVFWGWIKKGRYADLVMEHMVKKLIRTPRPKRTLEANQETHARRVLNAASKLHGKVAIITGNAIVEKAAEADSPNVSLVELWKQSGLKPRSVINEMAEDIQRQLLLEHHKESVQEAAE
jgi:hypothetical protein